MPMDRERPRGRKRRKVCSFCVDKVEHIDYKDAAKLRRFVSRAVQDPAPPDHRYLRHASAPVDPGHQAGPSDRPAALRHRLNSGYEKADMPHDVRFSYEQKRWFPMTLMRGRDQIQPLVAVLGLK